MPLDLTYCELKDRALKVKKSARKTQAATVTTIVLLLLLALAFGAGILPCPIHGY